MNALKIKTQKLIAHCQEYAARGRIVITGHDNPDADSVISAVMMKRLMDRCGVCCAVKFPTAPDNVTLRDVRALGLPAISTSSSRVFAVKVRFSLFLRAFS